MTSSLVGSEMCIRDSHKEDFQDDRDEVHNIPHSVCIVHRARLEWDLFSLCLLYTSDAADDM
eukprot:270593-Prorocentrum_lima.AAC.1